MMRQTKFQIGKRGLTDNFIETLKTAFKTHKQLRISVLKAASPDKARVKEIAAEMAQKLPFNTKHRIIGFTIIIRKSSKK